MLALVVSELLPQALREAPATAIAGTLLGAAGMLALSLALGV